MFENTFHQMLFQNGLVGLLVILSLPLIVGARSLVLLPRLPPEERPFAIMAVAGLAGILAASAVTPFLVSSYGMLALATMLSAAARASDQGARIQNTPNVAAA